eukprot:snap_masked-scaffold_11-processed-gene-8.28-mRNA-1 protein AED:0.40 eAED:0.40 QI:0/-1/0/1/-1/1/1/0/109
MYSAIQLSKRRCFSSVKNLNIPTGWIELKEATEVHIQKDLSFTDFPTAFAFMTQTAFEAEKMNHHPHFSNVYNSVTLTLTTHDATPPNTLTEKDISLAQKINEIEENFK